ncbi:MAG: iron-containing redox enzyme family protein [Pseudobdellovibrio sp.]
MNLKEVLHQNKVNQLVEIFQNQPWSNKEYYSNWLAQSHYYTSYSTRMLATAAGWSSPAEDKSYYRRSLKHISEEQGHDLIAINDLKALGINDLSTLPQLATTRALWEPQFYKILKEPTALLGYILALEILAVRAFKEFHHEIAKTYPANSLNFIKVHADDDPDHVESALEQIQNCQASEKINIEINFDQTLHMYSLMLDQIRITTTTQAIRK